MRRAWNASTSAPMSPGRRSESPTTAVISAPEQATATAVQHVSAVILPQRRTLISSPFARGRKANSPRDWGGRVTRARRCPQYTERHIRAGEGCDGGVFVERTARVWAGPALHVSARRIGALSAFSQP